MMHQGSHVKPRSTRKSGIRMNKLAVLFIAAVLLVGAVVGTTIAYLTAQTNEVENTFTVGSVPIKIEENFDGTTKKDVKVTNTGNTDAYIRATYVVNWLDSSNNIVASVPTGYSYSLTETTDANWKKGTDGYYYYIKPVAPNGTTEGSLLTCTVTYPTNPEYTLSVEIIASSIQAVPTNAVTTTWKTVTAVAADGTLTIG
jgi:predicted ribosomally synthesized peptide with SipW-like signal peptide